MSIISMALVEKLKCVEIRRNLYLHDLEILIKH